MMGPDRDAAAGSEDRLAAADPTDALKLWLALVEQTARTDRAEQKLDEVHSSTSWRVTAPLRGVRSWFQPVREGVALRGIERGDAAIQSQPLPSGSPRELASWIGQMRRGATSPRLFVDVTEVDLEDFGAGIQRVTKRVLVELMRKPRQLAIVPVRLSAEGRYCHAWRFSERLFGLVDGCLGVEQEVAASSADRFLGLDFCRRHHAAMAPALAALQRSGVGISIVVYDLLPWSHPHWFPEAVGRDYLHWLALISRFADQVLCISADVQSELERALADQKLELAGRSGTVPMGADGLDVMPRVRAGGPMRVLMVGTVEPRKGHAEALDAVERLWAQGSTTHLVFAGRGGWLSDALVERIRQHPQLGRRLFWHESPHDRELARLYASSDLLLMASEGEGYGLPLAEAGRAGCRLLARNLPVFREVAGERAAYFGGDSGSLADALAAADGTTWPDPQPASWITWAQCADVVADACMKETVHER